MSVWVNTINNRQRTASIQGKRAVESAQPIVPAMSTLFEIVCYVLRSFKLSMMITLLRLLTCPAPPPHFLSPILLFVRVLRCTPPCIDCRSPRHAPAVQGDHTCHYYAQTQQLSEPAPDNRETSSIQMRHEISSHLRNNPNMWQPDIELLVDHRTNARDRMPERTYNMTIADRVKKSGVRVDDNIIGTATVVLHHRDIDIL